MAGPFYDGMPDVNTPLNQLYAAFAAGPYNALPLTGGNLTGPVTSNSSISAATVWGQRLYAGYTGNAPQSVIARYDQPEGTELLSLAYCGDFYVCSGPAGTTTPAAMSLIRHSITGRSINCSGTINSNGADYAEYMVKRADCADVAPGQIIGIDAMGKITDRWEVAITFGVKSTSPGMVGGDNWAASVGERPVYPTRPAGSTDAQWKVLTDAYAAAMLKFNADIEAASKTVDRIAFCGQVPVNVQGATPGQYVVPVQDGDDIGGLLVDEDDITLAQYMRAVGKVILIEKDGRARIIVKVV